jgi:hypothetical protein
MTLTDDTRPPASGAKPRRRFRILYLAPVFALIALIAWALASPIGSSPDDDFHLASIWCANSADTAACTPGPKAGENYVPQAINLSAHCYNFRAGVSAACQTQEFSLNAAKKVLTSRGSFTGAYPPVYYAAMSVFVTPNILFSVVLMRVVNGILLIAMTTALFLLLPRVRRPTLIWAWLITTVPLGLFLIASNNPSSWAIIGIGSLWLALLGYFETTGKRRVGLGILTVLAAVMAGGARADSAIYAILSIAVVFVLTFRREKAYFLAAILPLALVVVSGIFYLGSGQSSVATTGLSTGSKNPPGIATLLLFNLEHIQSLWVGSFGVWNLGWLDTPMPPIVIFGSLGVAFALMFAGLARVSLRKLLALAVVALVLLFLPLYVLQQGRTFVGDSVQPRYLLPLIILFAGLCLLPVQRWRFHLSRLQAAIVVVALVVAQSFALHENMRRYITGIDVSGLNLNHNIEWWWPISVSPMVVWIAGTLAFAALVIVLVREVTKNALSSATAPIDPSVSTAVLTD